jgi:hypothetical protein
LKPILSRFCEIYVPEPVINNCITNLHTHSLNSVYGAAFKEYDTKHNAYLKTILNKFIKTTTSSDADGTNGTNGTNGSNENKSNESRLQECMTFIIKLYEKGYSSIDLIRYIEKHANIDELKKYEYLITFQKVKREFRNEKTLMLFILYFLVFRSELTLENISFI